MNESNNTQLGIGETSGGGSPHEPFVIRTLRHANQGGSPHEPEVYPLKETRTGGLPFPEDGPISGEAVAEAITRLRASRTGFQSLEALHRLIQRDGAYLDAEEWSAIETLCRACANGAAQPLALYLSRL